MVQGYKCEYCSNFNINKEIIELHELKCKFNLKNKGCYTCKNYYPNGYHPEYCKLVQVSDSEFYNYLKNGNCSHHQIEENEYN